MKLKYKHLILSSKASLEFEMSILFIFCCLRPCILNERMTSNSSEAVCSLTDRSTDKTIIEGILINQRNLHYIELDLNIKLQMDRDVRTYILNIRVATNKAVLGVCSHYRLFQTKTITFLLTFPPVI